MQTLQPATTLKELRNRIDEAIEIAGEDANGTALTIRRSTSATRLTPQPVWR